MRQLMIVISLLTLESCKTEQEIPDTKQITEIIIETIKQDSIDSNVAINSNLVNRYIYQQSNIKELGNLPPPPRNEKGSPFVFKLYKSSRSKLIGFDQTDSIFVSKQVMNNQNIILDSRMLPKNIEFKNIPIHNNTELRMYIFSIPLFNSDNDLAVVEYEYQCAGCGGGHMTFFRKIGDKWILANSFGTWRE